MTIQGIETTTWHDQRPTHARMSDTEWEARKREEEAWKAYDDATENILAIVDPEPEAYEAQDHARKLAEQASHRLSLILHAKHNPTETSELDF